ncbi:hypothetical protein V8E55_009782 [Tylopilus felleus]
MSSYDQTLLDEAPRATRAQLQEGYSVDLLEQPPRRAPSVRHPPPPQSPHPPPVPPVPVPVTPAIPETASREKLGSPVYAPTKPRTSFWRTRNGIITIFAIVLIVIGAVVGGAVGGTIKKTKNVDTTGTNESSSSGSSLPSSQSTPTHTGQGVSPGPSETASANPPTGTQNGQNSGGGTEFVNI